MKYSDGYQGTKAEFADFVKKVVPEMFSGRLVVEGKTVSLPADSNYDYKIKYDEDEQGGTVSIKVSWESQEFQAEDLNLDD